MKKQYIKIGLTLSMTLGLMTACGSIESEKYPWYEYPDETEETQQKEKITADLIAKEMREGMKLVLNPQEHRYQYQRANTIDTYAGYTTVTQNQFLYGGALPTTYTFPNSYLMGPYGTVSTLFPTIYNAYYHAEEHGVPYMKAVAMLMFDFAVQELVDIYGPVPFDDLRQVTKFPPLTYISEKDAYMRIFKELDEATDLLKKLEPTSQDLAKIEGVEGGLSRGDWRNWVKFANSLRLRMAMNIVKVDPALAQQQAEKAVADEIGVLTDADPYDFTQDRSNCSWFAQNPIYFIANVWNDVRLGASLENIMKRHKNPLLGKWWGKNKFRIHNSSGLFSGYGEERDWVGVRQGIAMINKKTEKDGYGTFSAGTSSLNALPLPWIKRTEVLFIMAEGALRGWAMGASARDLYERGIKLSFLENELSQADIDEYMKLEAAEDVDYQDPYNPENNIKGRVTIGVAWSDEDSNEVKLEKIITQKYMAVFPASAPTWTTFRRTGYPRLFPVYLNNWPGVDGELQLRRIPYIADVNNRADLAKLPALMNGQPNEGGSRLWWDVQTEQRGEPGDDKAKSPRVIPVNF